MPTYGADLAYIHDTGFGGFALQSAPGLLGILRRNGIHDGLVVDLGCGSGIWARQLGFAGYEVLGVDASADMIRLAMENSPRAEFRTDSLCDVPLPRCMAVTSIGECLSYAFAKDTGCDRLLRLFRRIHRALREGGVFIFDYAKTGREPAGMPRNVHWAGVDWAVLVDGEEDVTHGVLTRRLTSFRKIGRLYRRSEETHKLRLFHAGELEQVLERAGFEAKRLRGYGRVRFRSGHTGVLARKAG